MISTHVNRSIDVIVVEKNFAYLSASQDYLPGHEDEEHDFRFDHTVDQTRE